MGIRTSDVYSGDFMKSDQFKSANGEYATVRLTINGASLHEWDDGKKQIVISFAEDDRKLGLNVTNSMAIEELTGSKDTDGWMGKRIELYVDPNVMFGGKKIPAIRVRSVGGTSTAPSDPPATPITKAALVKAFATWASMDPKDPNLVPRLSAFTMTAKVELPKITEAQAKKCLEDIGSYAGTGMNVDDAINAANDIPF